MTKTAIRLLSVLLLLAPLTAQAQWIPQWYSLYTGPYQDNDVPTDLTVDASGNAYMTALLHDSTRYFDGLICKFAPNGTLLWQKLIESQPSKSDYAWDIATDADGRVYVAGGKYIGTAHHGTLTCYDPDGAEVWSRSTGNISTSNGWAAMTIFAARDLYALTDMYEQGTYGLTLFKCNLAGDSLWQVFVPAPLTPSMSEIVDGYFPWTSRLLETAPSGDVYAAAGIGEGSDKDLWLVRFTSDGDTVWTRRYDGPQAGADTLSAMAVDAAGNVFLAGATRGANGKSDFLVLRYSAAGALSWARTIDGPGQANDRAWGLAADAAGNVIVTGVRVDLDNRARAFTIKYSAAGDSLWADAYTTTLLWQESNGQSVILGADGEAFVCGSGYVTSVAGSLFIRYGSDGTRAEWATDQCSLDAYNRLIYTHMIPDGFGGIYLGGRSTCNFSEASDIVMLRYYNMSSAVRDLGDPGPPAAARLEQNYPNPFNSATTIRFTVDVPGAVDLSIYDVLGRVVRRDHETALAPGVYGFDWDGRDDEGREVASGVYFYRLQSATAREIRKMVLLR